MSHSCFFAPISGRVQIGVRILKSTPCVYITGMQHQGRVVPPPFFAADTFLNFTHKKFCWSCIINETETNEFLLNSTELPSSPLWIRQVFSFLMFNPPPLCLFFKNAMLVKMFQMKLWAGALFSTHNAKRRLNIISYFLILIIAKGFQSTLLPINSWGAKSLGQRTEDAISYGWKFKKCL